MGLDMSHWQWIEGQWGRYSFPTTCSGRPTSAQGVSRTPADPHTGLATPPYATAMLKWSKLSARVEANH